MGGGNMMDNFIQNLNLKQTHWLKKRTEFMQLIIINNAYKTEEIPI